MDSETQTIVTMPPTSSRPKLAQLATPATGTFPSELSALSATTPLSARPLSCKFDPIRTPISPPTAYTDFLRALSPVVPSKRSESGETTPESVPSTASSEQTDCSCKCESQDDKPQVSAKLPTAPFSAPVIPPSPFSQLPMSAPPTGAHNFPSLKIPPSPALSNVDSPRSASTARSPFSARSVQSHFDWDAALKARLSETRKPGRTSVRHIREVVTRTVTYTPRMNPAPKGKRRKVE